MATALRLNPNLSLPLTARAAATQAAISTDASATWETSFADYDLAIERDPKNATAWLWRGINHMTIGYFDLAEKDLLQCQNVDPAYENCRRWMAMLRLDQGRNEEAIALYEAGLKKGFFNQNAQFAQAYAAQGNKVMALALLASHFSDVPNLIEPIFRSLADPAFTASERKDALVILDSLSGQTANLSDARLLLRDYDHISITDPDTHYWWVRSDPVFFKSAARKRLMRAWKLPDYWRKLGFPPQCHAVGADDFECN